MARNVGCDAGASYPTYSDYSDLLRINLSALRITSVALVPPKPKLLDITVVGFAIGRFGHDVQTRSLLVQLFNVDAGAIKPCSSISRE